MKKVLIVGACSAIAKEVAKCFAKDGSALFLIARNVEMLKNITQDLKAQGAATVDYAVMDANDFDQHEIVLAKARDTLSGLDAVLIAYGTLSDQKICEKDFDVAKKELSTNFLSVVSLLTVLANYFEKQEGGSIAVLTSVAGDRGRRSNYIYGTAKGALSIFLQGIRNRLSKKGITVTTVKAGPINTPMTAHIKKGLLFANTEVVGRRIYQAIKKKKDVVYLPGFWWIIMVVLKLIPERFFKRLNL